MHNWNRLTYVGRIYFRASYRSWRKLGYSRLEARARVRVAISGAVAGLDLKLV